MPKLRSLIISALKLMQLLVEALKVYAGNPFTSEGSGAEADKITHGARLSCLTPVALPLQNLLVSGRRRALRCTQSAEEDSYPRVMLLPLKKKIYMCNFGVRSYIEVSLFSIACSRVGDVNFMVSSK